MKSTTFSKIAGIIMMITGTGHTATHFMFQLSPNPHPELERIMANTTVNIGKEISVLNFHNGFSIAMGVLLIALGFNIFRNSDKFGSSINLIFVGLIMSISIYYFPPFVMVLTALSFIFLSIRLFKHDR